MVTSEDTIKLKTLEWNINGRIGYGNYSIPEFVADEIMTQNAAIVILTEFVLLCGWDYFRGVLGKKYKFFSSPFISGQNGVLIAIKKDIDGLNYDSIVVTSEMNTNKIEKPNFLQLEVEIAKVPLIIIGTRIKVGDKNNNLTNDFISRKNQFDALYDHLEKIKGTFVVAGDLNHGAIYLECDQHQAYKGYAREFYNYQMIWRKIDKKNYTLATPDKGGKYGAKYSTVSKDNNIGKLYYTKLDHIISNGVKVTNPDYCWGFVNPNNGYGGLKKEDYKSHLISLPDHAILTATIEI